MFSVLGYKKKNIDLKLVKPEVSIFPLQLVTELKIRIDYKVIKYLSKRSLSWKNWWATQYNLWKTSDSTILFTSHYWMCHTVFTQKLEKVKCHPFMKSREGKDRDQVKSRKIMDSMG